MQRGHNTSLALTARTSALMFLFWIPMAAASESADTSKLESRCAAKNVGACVEAAEAHRSIANHAMAMTMYKRACFFKHQDACLKLAEMALENNLAGLAREALEEGCRYESPWACQELTRLDQQKKHSEGDDPAKSMRVWSLACTKGSATGCRKQAEMEKSLGQADAARASYLRGCSLGDKISCAAVTAAPAH